jgi:hypothetical protein
LTLWQAGKELKTYPIGIGHRGFPLPIAERLAMKLDPPVGVDINYDT